MDEKKIKIIFMNGLSYLLFSLKVSSDMPICHPRLRICITTKNKIGTVITTNIDVHDIKRSSHVLKCKYFINLCYVPSIILHSFIYTSTREASQY